jgi:hypothetical protein
VPADAGDARRAATASSVKAGMTIVRTPLTPNTLLTVSDTRQPGRAPSYRAVALAATLPALLPAAFTATTV